MRAKIDADGNIHIPNSPHRQSSGDQNTYHTPPQTSISTNRASIFVGLLKILVSIAFLVGVVWLVVDVYLYREARREAMTIVYRAIDNADSLSPHCWSSKYFYERACEIDDYAFIFGECKLCGTWYCSKHMPDVRIKLERDLQFCKDFLVNLGFYYENLNTDDKRYIYWGCKKILYADERLQDVNFQRLNNRSESEKWESIRSELRSMTWDAHSVFWTIEKPLKKKRYFGLFD